MYICNVYMYLYRHIICIHTQTHPYTVCAYTNTHVYRVFTFNVSPDLPMADFYHSLKWHRLKFVP